MNDRHIYGLTGMSGAGKTTVCDIFRADGFYIINCDSVARSVTEKGSPCLKELADAFGDIYDEEGCLDRRRLGSVVFSDREKLKMLDRIIYPYITYRVLKLIENSDADFILLDAPTLFESGIDFICDGIVSVVCDKKLSVDRIMKRDAIDEASALARLESQNDKEFYIEKSDIYIENNADLKQLEEKTLEAVRLIRQR